MTKSFEDRDGWIWMNGNFIPWKNATSHIISQGLHYASAVFEGERAYNGKIFKSEEHTKRFFKSAEIIGIKIPYSEDELNSAKKELIKKMNYKDCYVRPLAWRGGDQMGISTTQSNINVAIAVWDDWASYFKIEDRKAGLKLITSSSSLLTGLKSGNPLDHNTSPSNTLSLSSWPCIDIVKLDLFLELTISIGSSRPP